MYKKEKGITLIALVITIIILIVLGAVALVTLSGDNGIITRAIQARQNTNENQEQELVDLIATTIRTEEKIREKEIVETEEDITDTEDQISLESIIDSVFGTESNGDKKATGEIRTQTQDNKTVTTYIIKVGEKNYIITGSGVEIGDESYVDPKYYYGTQIQTSYSGIYTNVTGEDVLVTKTDNSDARYNRKFCISKVTILENSTYC